MGLSQSKPAQKPEQRQHPFAYSSMSYHINDSILALSALLRLDLFPIKNSTEIRTKISPPSIFFAR